MIIIIVIIRIIGNDYHCQYIFVKVVLFNNFYKINTFWIKSSVSLTYSITKE